MKSSSSGKPLKPLATQKKDVVHVLVADSGAIQSQLLTRALKARRDLQVSAVALEVPALHSFMQSNTPDVVLISGHHLPDLGLVRWLHVSYPKVAPVLLVEEYDRELVVDSFRAGAKGIFLFNHAPFRLLCRCIAGVARGQIWINSQQMHYLLDCLSQVPTLRLLNAKGKPLVTPREEQVVALVADGLSNRPEGYFYDIRGGGNWLVSGPFGHLTGSFSNVIALWYISEENRRRFGRVWGTVPSNVCNRRSLVALFDRARKAKTAGGFCGSREPPAMPIGRTEPTVAISRARVNGSNVTKIGYFCGKLGLIRLRESGERYKKDSRRLHAFSG